MNWQIIVMIVLGAFSLLAGLKWKQFKSLVRESAEALTVLSDAIVDDKITKVELRSIVKEMTDVIMAFKALIGR